MKGEESNTLKNQIKVRGNRLEKSYRKIVGSIFEKTATFGPLKLLTSATVTKQTQKWSIPLPARVVT